MADAGSPVTKQRLKVLSQEIDSDGARYRIQSGHRVHYVTINGDPEQVFDEDTLCQPHLLLPALPEFPESSWTRMQLRRDPSHTLQSTIYYDALQGLEDWHRSSIEVTSLPRISTHNHRVYEADFQGQAVIAKIAPFEWWIPMADRETLTYEIITNEHPASKPPLAPLFLAQLTEQGRVMGFLIEKVHGDEATPSDLPACEVALRDLHALGLVHCDINRYNFIVDRITKQARIIDFEHTGLYTEEKGEHEIKLLQGMFSLDPQLGSTNILLDKSQETYI